MFKRFYKMLLVVIVQNTNFSLLQMIHLLEKLKKKLLMMNKFYHLIHKIVFSLILFPLKVVQHQVVVTVKEKEINNPNILIIIEMIQYYHQQQIVHLIFNNQVYNV
jgi:hypothetical protein